MGKKQEWNNYLISSIYEMKKAVSEFNNLLEQKRVEQFVIHAHISFNRLLIGIHIKTKKVYENNGRVKGFEALSGIFKHINWVTKDDRKLLKWLNDIRNDIEHRMIDEVSAKHEETFIILTSLHQVYVKLLKKIGSRHKFEENIIGSNEKISIDANNDWFSNSILEVLNNLESKKVVVEKVITTEKEVPFDYSKWFTLKEATMTIAKVIPGFTIGNLTHIHMSFNIFSKNYEKLTYGNWKKDLEGIDKRYAELVREKRFVNKKFIDDVVKICQKKPDYKEFFKDKYDKKATLDIKKFI